MRTRFSRLTMPALAAVLFLSNSASAGTGSQPGLFFNGFEGNDVSAWWFTGNVGIDRGAGLAFDGQNEGWVRATTGWSSLTVRLGDPAATYASFSTNCVAMVWIRTSSTLTNGYFAVRDQSNGNAIVAQNGPFGNWPASPSPSQLKYNYVPVFFTQPGSDRLSLEVGFWGNGRDAWLQVDDASVVCGAELTFNRSPSSAPGDLKMMRYVADYCNIYELTPQTEGALSALPNMCN